MKYTTALTVLLAFGPATSVLAAPLTQDPTSALTAGPAPGGQASPAPGGSSSQGMSGSSMGNEGLLDKVEKIVKDVLGGVSSSSAADERKEKSVLIKMYSCAREVLWMNSGMS